VSQRLRCRRQLQEQEQQQQQQQRQPEELLRHRLQVMKRASTRPKRKFQLQLGEHHQLQRLFMK